MCVIYFGEDTNYSAAVFIAPPSDMKFQKLDESIQAKANASDEEVNTLLELLAQMLSPSVNARP